MIEGPEALIERLRSVVHPLDHAPPATAVNADDFTDLLPQPLRPAAVLVPVIIGARSPRLLLTRRTEALRHHAGQVSFPGGAIDRDDGTAINAALRETWEETGIEPSFVQPIGYLDRLDTISAYSITPVVALVHDGFIARPEPGEVAEIFEVPLDYVLAPDRMQSTAIEWKGRSRRIHEFHFEGRRIWGVTAAILLNLIHRLEPPR